MKSYFKKVTDNGIVANKKIWKFVKLHLTSKCCPKQNNILLIKHDKIVSEEKVLVETFNNHYIHKYS